MRLWRGRSTPAIRAMSYPPSPGAACGGVLADHAHDALAADDLALVADLLDRRSDLHRIAPDTRSTTFDSRPYSAALSNLETSRKRHSTSVSATQHHRTVIGDGDRMLEMGGEATIFGHSRPAVIFEHFDLGAPGVHHRLDGEDQPGFQPQPLARRRRSSGPAGPRASPGRCRGRRTAAPPSSRAARRATARPSRCPAGDCPARTAAMASSSDVAGGVDQRLGLVGDACRWRRSAPSRRRSRP